MTESVERHLLNSGFHATYVREDNRINPVESFFDLNGTEKVLLVNPPIYDTRLPWAQWVQPVNLLKLGTFLKSARVETRLLDAIHLGYGKRLKRKVANTFGVDDLAVKQWRFGLQEEECLSLFESFRDESWEPDKVIVNAFTTFWWEGVREAVDNARRAFPNCEVILLGAYPRLAKEHAEKNSGADIFLSDLPPYITSLSCDFELYEGTPPSFGYVSRDLEQSSPDDLVEAVRRLLTANVTKVAFAEHNILRSYPSLFQETLEAIIASNLKPHFFALGNINASDLVNYPKLPGLMKEAGFKQVSFADDRYDDEPPEKLVENYAIATRLCVEAGFSERTEAINAGVSIGKPGESLEERARLASHFAHQAGSVIFWPYQPSPDEGLETPLELQNGKLFPYRTKNGYSYRDYLNVLGTGTVFNARYRGKSFDFLGEGLMSRLFQKSVVKRGWEPDPSVKGSVNLPARGPR